MYKRDDILSFYIALNEAISKIRPNFKKIVSKTFLCIQLIRMKLENIAEI
jgi:hypothetical protein